MPGSVRCHIRIVRVQVRFGIIARADLRAGKNRRDLVRRIPGLHSGRVLEAVLIPGNNEETVVRDRPRQIGVDDVCLQPVVALLDRPVMHVVLLVGHDE